MMDPMKAAHLSQYMQQKVGAMMMEAQAEVNATPSECMLSLLTVLASEMSMLNTTAAVDVFAAMSATLNTELPMEERQAAEGVRAAVVEKWFADADLYHMTAVTTA